MSQVISLDPRITAYNRFKDEVVGAMLKSGAISKMPFMHDFSVVVPVKLDKNKNQLKFSPNGKLDKHVAGQYIDENDIFAVHKMGLFVTSWNDDDKVYSKEEFTYPDKVFFSAAEVAELERVYKGTLSMDSKDYNPIRELSTRVFRYVPQIQSGAAAHSNINDDGMFRLIQTPVLSGRASTVFQLDLGYGGSTAIEGESDAARNYVLLRFDGFVASGISTEFDKWRKG